MSHWTVSCTENSNLCLRLFSKLTYSFGVIEFLAFSIMQNSIFIAQESSRYLGFKKCTPYVKRIGLFAFCLYKNVSQKNSFLYSNVNNNDSHQRKITYTFLYILYWWSPQLALRIIRTYDWSVSQIRHSFKFVQNRSKIF